MRLRGLYIGADLKQLTEMELVNLFGKSGRFFYKIVRGIDNSRVEPNRKTKSIAAEDTFSEDLSEIEEMNVELEKIAQVIFNRIQHHPLKGRTLTVKVKFNDFKIITRSRSYPEVISKLDFIILAAKAQLLGIDFTGRKVRLLGISISNFESEPNKGKINSYQGRLFP